jgi:hypothetical protein
VNDASATSSIDRDALRQKLERGDEFVLVDARCR